MGREGVRECIFNIIRICFFDNKLKRVSILCINLLYKNTYLKLKFNLSRHEIRY